MNRKSKSILEELNTFVSQKNREEIIESKAQHIIVSAINLIEMIESKYTNVEADALKKRFISSIKGKDPDRFTRMVDKIKEGRLDSDDSIV